MVSKAGTHPLDPCPDRNEEVADREYKQAKSDRAKYADGHRTQGDRDEDRRDCHYGAGKKP